MQEHLYCNLLAFVFLVVGQKCGGDYVAQTVQDQVGEGNYTYYTLSHPGPLILKLTSLEGDADLYVSSDIPQPTYMFEEHSLSSATCGEDRLEISSLIQRPINIAVYGHPRYLISIYSLDVIVVETASVDSDPFKEVHPDDLNDDQVSDMYRSQGSYLRLSLSLSFFKQMRETPGSPQP